MTARDDLWTEVCRLDQLADEARGRYLRATPDAAIAIGEALQGPGPLAPALRTLMVLSETDRRRLLPELVHLASWYIVALVPVRNAIASLDRAWLCENIEPIIWRELAPEATYEEYRLLAELLRGLDCGCLAELVRRALLHDDPDIQEVGRDFSALG
jgi:hypothetical protein